MYALLDFTGFKWGEGVRRSSLWAPRSWTRVPGLASQAYWAPAGQESTSVGPTVDSYGSPPIWIQLSLHGPASRWTTAFFVPLVRIRCGMHFCVRATTDRTLTFIMLSYVDSGHSSSEPATSEPALFTWITTVKQNPMQKIWTNIKQSVPERPTCQISQPPQQLVFQQSTFRNVTNKQKNLNHDQQSKPTCNV